MTATGTLLIDIGNTRIKWARVYRGRRGRQHGAALGGDGGPVFRRLFKSLPRTTRVLAVNVAGSEVERALRAAASGAGLPAPRLLRSVGRTPLAAGVLVNGYAESWRLGADRWAVMLGARQATRGRRPLCVVDIGTAMTVDFVDAQGNHRGGYIVPGPMLAVSSLLAGTSGIRRRAAKAGAAAGLKDRPWPRSTLPAILRGSLEGCAAMITRCHAQARSELGARTQLVLTGGAAPAVLPLLPDTLLHLPDLVLQGLEAWGNC